jgi:hypothetical protein
VVNLDRDHTITVYDWKANLALSKFYGGTNHILGVFFVDADPRRDEGECLAVVLFRGCFSGTHNRAVIVMLWCCGWALPIVCSLVGCRPVIIHV